MSDYKNGIKSYKIVGDLQMVMLENTKDSSDQIEPRADQMWVPYESVEATIKANKKLRKTATEYAYELEDVKNTLNQTRTRLDNLISKI